MRKLASGRFQYSHSSLKFHDLSVDRMIEAWTNARARRRPNVVFRFARPHGTVSDRRLLAHVNGGEGYFLEPRA
jgi:hypothetical protein